MRGFHCRLKMKEQQNWQNSSNETNDFNCTISCTSESKADSRLASLVHGLHEHGKVKLPPQFPSFVSALRLVCRLTTAWFTWHQSEGKQCIVFGLYWRLCAVIFYVYTRFMRSGCWSQCSRKAQWRTLVIFLVSWRASKKRKQDSGEQHRASQTVLLRYSFYSDILQNLLARNYTLPMSVRATSQCSPWLSCPVPF